jgi:TIR domain
MAASEAPRVFFSYAGEDEVWVSVFRNPKWFKIGNARILDFAVEEVGYGELKRALDAQIEQSAVFVAFVSGNYTREDKKWTFAEWEKALEQLQRRRLIFVPIMLDADAIAWWRKLQNQGQLSTLQRAYQYADFTDGGGRRIQIQGDKDTVAVEKIARLAEQIRHDLQIPPPDLRTSPPRPPPYGTEVVVLGHSKAALPKELLKCADSLCEALRTGGIRIERWGDGWRGNSDARGGGSTDSETIFVQPVPIGEASDLALDQGIIGKDLERAGIQNARVVLWLPPNFSDKDFSNAVAKAVNGKDFPSLRSDSPVDLAKWLQTLRSSVASSNETKIQIQAFGLMEAKVGEQTAASLEIVEQLKKQIFSIASAFVDNPQPSPPALSFWCEEFGEQLRKLDGNRVIVAVHDLDVAPGLEIKKQLQLRFECIQEAIRQEQEVRVSAGKPRLKAFLTALLVRSADAIPFDEYPYDGRYGDWSLLRFSPPKGEQRETSVKPNPYSLAVLNGKLYSWAHPAPQPLQ